MLVGGEAQIYPPEYIKSIPETDSYEELPVKWEQILRMKKQGLER